MYDLHYFCVLIFLSDAGSRLPNVTILLPTEKKQVDIDEKEKTLKLAGRCIHMHYYMDISAIHIYISWLNF